MNVRSGSFDIFFFFFSKLCCDGINFTTTPTSKEFGIILSLEYSFYKHYKLSCTVVTACDNADTFLSLKYKQKNYYPILFCWVYFCLHYATRSLELTAIISECYANYKQCYKPLKSSCDIFKTAVFNETVQRATRR